LNLDLVILIILTLAALWTVMAWSLIRSAIGLALASAILTIIMFRLDSPLAAVFELSVCAGLIPVLFVSIISLTHPLSRKEVTQQVREKFSRFWYLPVIICFIAIIASLMRIKSGINLPPPEKLEDVRFVLWNLRQLDLIGQVIILLAGVFGIAVLFKEKEKK
jgi:NADH-quinone oxidoreductase subunit J